MQRKREVVSERLRHLEARRLAQSDILFTDTATSTTVSFNGQSGTYTFAPGVWTEADILRVDVALGNVHRHVGNKPIRSSAGADHFFSIPARLTGGAEGHAG